MYGRTSTLLAAYARAAAAITAHRLRHTRRPAPATVPTRGTYVKGYRR